MRPTPQGLEPHLKAFLDEIRSAVTELQGPGRPQQEFAVASTSLPPAASYKNCRCLVTDKNCIAISTLSGGVWTWLRANGGAL